MNRALEAAVFAVALVGMPLTAHGQATIQVKKASSEDLAAASAEADTLIASTGAPQLFENVSSDGLVKVRHKASGLQCTFVPGLPNNSLMLFDSEAIKNDDVGCNADMGPINFTYYATRYGPDYSAEDAARDALSSIRDTYPDARPYEGSPVRVEFPAGVSSSGFSALLIGPPDNTRYAHAATAQIGEWIYKQRMTGKGDADTITANQIFGGAVFNTVLQSAIDR